MVVMKKQMILLLLGVMSVATFIIVPKVSIVTKADVIEVQEEQPIVVEPIPTDEIYFEPEVMVIEETPYIVVDMPERSRDFKSYMDYRRLGKYLQADLQEVATTDEDGFRVVDGRYLIAVGTAVSDEVGTYVTLVLENGTEIECIVGDVKDDMHTQENNIVTEANECVSEFIIDKDVMENGVLRMGSVSYAFEEWKSMVVSIKVEDRNYFN